MSRSEAAESPSPLGRGPEGTHVLIVGPTLYGAAYRKIEERYPTTVVNDVEHGLQALDSLRPKHILLWLGRDIPSAVSLIRKAHSKGADVIVIGPDGDRTEAQQVLQAGARRYFPQAVADEQLHTELSLPAQHRLAAVQSLDIAHSNRSADSPALGRSGVMQDIFKQVERVAPTSATVLLIGESGSGKEVIARAVHQKSRRRECAFVPVNCGAISPQLIESELFGHERGSFTGAVREHKGYFERAHGGTLFLDEITEMPVELQVKLLRVLETRLFAKVGSTRERKTDVRIIAATNTCPRRAMETGRLREDLFYRLQVFPIRLPALRERDDDIPLLAEHFLNEFNHEEQQHKYFSEAALQLLRGYSWPGNLRELKNVVYRGFLVAGQVIQTDDLPAEIKAPRSRRKGPCITVEVGSSLSEVEEELIWATLEHCRGKREKAARLLGVSTKTLYNRLREYNSTGRIRPETQL